MRTTLLLGSLVILCAGPALGQFGQNKITFGGQTWNVYESPHFDVYYNFADQAALRALVSEAESAYLDISRRLDHEVSQRIPMILYGTQSEFQRTNITPHELPDAVAAFAEPIQFRLVLPIDTPPEERYKTIRHEITHIFQYSILYAGSLRRTLQGRAPFWFMEGMASYVADDEDSLDQMAIRDAVVMNVMPSIRQMNVQSYLLAYRYGHAVFDFIEETWGDQGLQNLIFEVRKALLANNVDKAFRDAFGIDIETFDRRFSRYLRTRYLPILTSKRAPDEYGPEIGLTKRRRYTFSPTLSPSGELVAAIATPTNRELDVVVLSSKDGELIRNLTKGMTNRYRDVVTEAFGGRRDLSWSPSGDAIAFFVRKAYYRALMIYDPVTGDEIDMIPFKEIAAVSSPAYSPDGRWIAFSGNVDGQWDLFRYNLETGATENLTDDPYFDTNPTWSSDGSQVIYNRRIGAFDKIFVVEVGNPKRKTQLTAGAASDFAPVFSKDGKYVYFTSDRGEYGVFNIHRLELSSANIDRLTDVVSGAFAPVEMDPADDDTPRLVYTAFMEQTFRLFRMKVGGDEVERAIEVGEQEPQTSPLAPSRRRAAREARERARSGDEVGAAETREAAAEAADAAVQDDFADADLEPFRPPLELTLDDERKRPYKTTWRLNSPGFTVGVTDDGALIAAASLQFTDILGNHQAFISSFSQNGYTNNRVAYLNLKNRLIWGAQFQDFRDYYLTSDFTGTGGGFADIVEQAQRYTSLLATAQYPFSRHYRVEGVAGYAQRRVNYPFFSDDGSGTLGIDFQRFRDDYPVAGIDFVGDTTRFQRWGPFQGHRFRIGAQQYWFTSGDNDGASVTAFNLDFRGYQRITNSSTLAFRVAGRYQTGDFANLYTLGGTNQLRGYRYREFFGENVAYANLELRFPLFNAIQWGFGAVMGPVRGFLFADVGSAWFEDELYVEDPFDPTSEIVRGRAVYDRRLGILRGFESRDEDGFLVDIKASVGAGLSVNFFGLPFTWAFASLYDGDEFGDWNSSFYIVYDW